MGMLMALRGVRGEYEINRILGAFGVGTYIVAAPAFQAWAILKGQPYDVAIFCGAYATGLGVAMGSIAGAVALKDRSVATARVTNAQADQPAS